MVWSGNISEGKWKKATKESTFFEVIEMGKRKQKGEVVKNACIVKFDGENELKIIQNKNVMKKEDCEAAQGGHSSAKYFSAQRLLTMEDKVCVKWADRSKYEWLPKCQVRDLTPSRSRSNARNARNLNEIDEIDQIYRIMRYDDTGFDNGI